MASLSQCMNEKHKTRREKIGRKKSYCPDCGGEKNPDAEVCTQCKHELHVLKLREQAKERHFKKYGRLDLNLCDYCEFHEGVKKLPHKTLSQCKWYGNVIPDTYECSTYSRKEGIEPDFQISEEITAKADEIVSRVLSKRGIK